MVHTRSLNTYVMNLQLNRSPKLTTRSLDLELTSSLKRFAACMYSMSSWHSFFMSSFRASLKSGVVRTASAADRWSSQMSWIRLLASSSNSVWVFSMPTAASIFLSLL